MPSDIPLSLPPEFAILDDDLIYVVTGYNKDGSILVSKETSIQSLRKYLVKIEGVSGIGVSSGTRNGITLYSSSKEGNLIDLTYGTIYPYDETISTTGLNSQTANLIAIDYQAQWPYSGVIYTTGLNAVIGNNMEIQFSAGTPAANKFGGVGYKYYSGIISTTGLNARTENLIVRDFESSWPNSGVIYNTGLNAIIGNNMEIQFATGTPASNLYGGTAGKYKSGIISTTGLNTRTENLIVRDFENSWPYSGVVYNTGLNAIIGNNIEIQFTSGTPASNLYGGTAGKYQSGIISTTGLNARSENLIVRDFESSWPNSGIIYNTGLNAIIGNNMEIQFATGTPAANKFRGVGGKYLSGIISTTGLNSRTENNIVLNFDNSWPSSGIIYNTGLNAIVGNNMEIQFATGTPASNTYGGTGGKYISGIISTTGLNMIPGTGITVDISPNWPYAYTISTLDRSIYADANMTIDDTKTYFDPYINPNIPTKSSKYPSVPNYLKRGFLIEYCILSIDIINTTPSTVNTSGRPTEINGNTITWNSCYVTHLSPATLNLQVYYDENPFGFWPISIPDQTEKAVEAEFAFDLPTQGLSYYSYPPNSLHNINLKLWKDIDPWPDSYYDIWPGLSLSLQPAYSFVRSTYRWTCNGTYTYMIGGSYALGNTVWNSPTYTSNMTLSIKNRYMKLNYATRENRILSY